VASAYLADDLITAVQEEGLLPASDESSLTTKVRRILNREQRLYLQALLQKAREEYQTDWATLSVVAGTTEYRIPTRAVGAAIRRLEDTTNGTAVLYPVDSLRAGQPYGTGDFYVKGNKLVLVATPTDSATLRVVYARRFNQIVAATEAREITAFNLSTGALTLASTKPTAFTTSRTYDIVRGTPHFDVMAKDVACSVASGTSLTLTAADLPSDLAIGDYVSLAGETAICNAPLELQDVLVLKACHSYVASGGDAGKAALLKERLVQAEMDALNLITPRVKDTPPLLINFHAPGWNRGHFRRRPGSS
jgi:hypothetical protein